MSHGWTGLIIRRYPTIRGNSVYLYAVETYENSDSMTCGEYLTHKLDFNSRFKAVLFLARFEKRQYKRVAGILKKEENCNVTYYHKK